MTESPQTKSRRAKYKTLDEIIAIALRLIRTEKREIQRAHKNMFDDALKIMQQIEKDMNEGISKPRKAFKDNLEHEDEEP